MANERINTPGTRRVILVLKERWNLFAHQSLTDPSRIYQARVLQRWGTTGGLAQLANQGAQKETLLSDVFDGEVPPDSILFTLNVHDDARIGD